MHHFAYRDGMLSAEAVDLVTLAKAVGTPFYCYASATLERHYRVFAGGLDHGSGLRHRPATAIVDALAVSSTDSHSVALWNAHVERTRAAARSFKAGWPSPRVAARDPYALRALVLIACIATFVAAPQARTKNGVAQTIKDVTDHPWASAEVVMTLPPAMKAATRAGASRSRSACRSVCSPNRWRGRWSSSGAISRSTRPPVRWSSRPSMR